MTPISRPRLAGLAVTAPTALDRACAGAAPAIFYAGWPAAMSGAEVSTNVTEGRAA